MVIDELRWEIDELDRKLVEILSERARLVLKIAGEKQALGLSNRQPDREREVLRNVVFHNPGLLEGDAIRRIFQAIIAECLRLEEVASSDTGDGPRSD